LFPGLKHAKSSLKKRYTKHRTHGHGHTGDGRHALPKNKEQKFI